MPIDLGLARVANLLSKLGNPHLKSNFIHISGTNGKGSVCAYLTSLLIENTKDFKIGKFTSPHLLDRNDSVTLNNIPVPFTKFSKVENDVLNVNKEYNIGATEFEILTATAFQIFHLEKVDLAVLEVGLGGRLDATNVVEPALVNQDKKIIQNGVLVTGVTKIGMDHENILGSTLKEIAREKAGIIKHEIPNVIDGTNDDEVLQVIKQKAQEQWSENHPVISNFNKITTSFGTVNREESPLKGSYQLQNLSVSLKILDLIFPFLKVTYPEKVNFSLQNITKGIQKVEWPGRLQSLNLKYSPNESEIPVLLDGAHNGQAAKELGKYLHAKHNHDPITFILAVTKGKDLEPLLKELIRKQDTVIVTKFGSVDQMPWVKANDPHELKQEILKYTKNVQVEEVIPEAFKLVNKDDPVVVCGSLYLVGEVLRLHRKNIEN